MSLSTFALAAAALAAAGAAAAEPILVLNPPATRRAPPPASDCAAAPSAEGADIECVLSLTPPQRGVDPAPPSRILIRMQWAPEPCARRDVQVVELAGRPARPKGLPVVEQARSDRSCRS